MPMMPRPAELREPSLGLAPSHRQKKISGATPANAARSCVDTSASKLARELQFPSLIATCAAPTILRDAKLQHWACSSLVGARWIALILLPSKSTLAFPPLPMVSISTLSPMFGSTRARMMPPTDASPVEVWLGSMIASGLNLVRMMPERSSSVRCLSSFLTALRSAVALIAAYSLSREKPGSSEMGSVPSIQSSSRRIRSVHSFTLCTSCSIAHSTSAKALSLAPEPGRSSAIRLTPFLILL
mmetsp:Transcript_30574/g.93578  ORF Transcript_30574/g.93578 Transcript_30574/m.93578 type:complete len:243 (+) Transcript_30574:1352-2080(+)